MHRLTIAGHAGSRAKGVQVLNCLDGKYKADIFHDAQVGLSAPQRRIPCKYFYDARGSELFEEICLLPEYYPTRIELAILRAIAPDIMNTSAHRDLVELGSGATVKIRTLLDAAENYSRNSMRYIPVDISESAIRGACDHLLTLYPELQVLGIVADFTRQLDVIPIERPTMICFLGGTIGNMEPEESVSFLREIARNLKPDDRVMVGFDMLKERYVIEPAYNDSRGVTAKFNKNILRVLNSQLKAEFDERDFEHLAFLNNAESRIEMHLVANKDVQVNIQSIGLEIEMKKGETIHTENSRKFTRTNVENMAKQAGLCIQGWHSDSNGWFSLVLMGQRGASLLRRTGGQDALQ